MRGVFDIDFFDDRYTLDTLLCLSSDTAKVISGYRQDQEQGTLNGLDFWYALHFAIESEISDRINNPMHDRYIVRN